MIVSQRNYQNQQNALQTLTNAKVSNYRVEANSNIGERISNQKAQLAEQERYNNVSLALQGAQMAVDAGASLLKAFKSKQSADNANTLKKALNYADSAISSDRVRQSMPESSYDKLSPEEIDQDVPRTIYGKDFSRVDETGTYVMGKTLEGEISNGRTSIIVNWKGSKKELKLALDEYDRSVNSAFNMQKVEYAQQMKKEADDTALSLAKSTSITQAINTPSIISGIASNPSTREEVISSWENSVRAYGKTKGNPSWADAVIEKQRPEIEREINNAVIDNIVYSDGLQKAIDYAKTYGGKDASLLVARASQIYEHDTSVKKEILSSIDFGDQSVGDIIDSNHGFYAIATAFGKEPATFSWNEANGFVDNFSRFLGKDGINVVSDQGQANELIDAIKEKKKDILLNKDFIDYENKWREAGDKPVKRKNLVLDIDKNIKPLCDGAEIVFDSFRDKLISQEVSIEAKEKEQAKLLADALEKEQKDKIDSIKSGEFFSQASKETKLNSIDYIGEGNISRYNALLRQKGGDGKVHVQSMIDNARSYEELESIFELLDNLSNPIQLGIDNMSTYGQIKIGDLTVQNGDEIWTEILCADNEINGYKSACIKKMADTTWSTVFAPMISDFNNNGGTSISKITSSYMALPDKIRSILNDKMMSFYDNIGKNIPEWSELEQTVSTIEKEYRKKMIGASSEKMSKASPEDMLEVNETLIYAKSILVNSLIMNPSKRDEAIEYYIKFINGSQEKKLFRKSNSIDESLKIKGDKRDIGIFSFRVNNRGDVNSVGEFLNAGAVYKWAHYDLGANGGRGGVTYYGEAKDTMNKAAATLARAIGESQSKASGLSLNVDGATFYSTGNTIDCSMISIPVLSEDGEEKSSIVVDADLRVYRDYSGCFIPVYSDYGSRLILSDKYPKKDTYVKSDAPDELTRAVRDANKDPDITQERVDELKQFITSWNGYDRYDIPLELSNFSDEEIFEFKAKYANEYSNKLRNESSEKKSTKWNTVLKDIVERMYTKHRIDD